MKYLHTAPFLTRAWYGASIYWQYTGPDGTSLLAEGGDRIPGYWQFTYVLTCEYRTYHVPI